MNLRTRVAGAVMLAAAIVVGGCAIDEVTPVPRCDGGESLVIVAQSVQDGSFVPCIADRDVGWTAVRVQIDEEGTRLEFSLGPERRARGVVSFASECPDGVAAGPGWADVGAGVEEGVAGSMGRWYRFTGGCVVVDVADGVGRDAARALVDSVELIERAELEIVVRRDFVDEEL